jgi:K+-sensing histidine kinase KdpD
MQVWDTGRGIPPGQQEKVFQEYYPIDNPERDREKGLGCHGSA